MSAQRPLPSLLTGPHARACLHVVHAHGDACASDCPTCHGRSDQAAAPVVTAPSDLDRVLALVQQVRERGVADGYATPLRTKMLRDDCDQQTETARTAWTLRWQGDEVLYAAASALLAGVEAWARRHGARDLGPAPLNDRTRCLVCEKPLSATRIGMGLRACCGPCNAAIRQMRS